MFCYLFVFFVHYVFFNSFCKWTILYSLFKCAKKNQKQKLSISCFARAWNREKMCSFSNWLCVTADWRNEEKYTQQHFDRCHLNLFLFFILSFSLHTKTPKKRNVHSTVEKFLQVFALFFLSLFGMFFFVFFLFNVSRWIVQLRTEKCVRVELTLCQTKCV